MRQQLPANSLLLATRAHISVPHQRHIPHLLDAHNARQFPALLVAPEHHTLIDLLLQFLARHVWFRPAIRRNRPLISLRAIVDNRPNHLKVSAVTPANHGYSAPRCRFLTPTLRGNSAELSHQSQHVPSSVRIQNLPILEVVNRDPLQRDFLSRGGNSYVFILMRPRDGPTSDHLFSLGDGIFKCET